MMKQEAIAYLQTLPDSADVVIKTWSTEDVDRVLKELRLKSRISPRVIHEFEKANVLEDFARRLNELGSMADKLLSGSAVEILEEFEEAMLRVERIVE